MCDQAYSDIIVLDPVNPRSYYLYAIAAGQLGRTEEAEMYFRNAIRIRPWYIDALYNLVTSAICLDFEIRPKEPPCQHSVFHEPLFLALVCRVRACVPCSPCEALTDRARVGTAGSVSDEAGAYGRGVRVLPARQLRQPQPPWPQTVHGHPPWAIGFPI